MRKRFSTTDIDRFFTHLKEQPPIYEEEKVHQIINSPEAKARLKGKNKNLLKFTVMTTIFAIIVSAVLLWTGHDNDNQVSSIKNQDTRQVSGSDEQTGNAVTEDLKNYLCVAKKNSKDDENKCIALSELNKGTSEEVDSNTLVSNSQQMDINQDKCYEPAQQNVQKPIDFDRSTIQPTDGSRFVLKLTNEEFEKIGVFITDSSFIYKNRANGYCYQYGATRRKIYYDDNDPRRSFIDENGKKCDYPIDMVDFRRKESEGDEITNFDFYPVFKSNTYYDVVIPNGTLAPLYFETSNDTLVPILFPSLEGPSSLEPFLVWFTLTDKLYQILSENHKKVLDELMRYKLAKEYVPGKNLVKYKSPYSVDKTAVLQLENSDLKKLGFTFYEDSMTYEGSYKNFTLSYAQSRNYSTIKSFEADSANYNGDMLTILITSKNGTPRFDELFQSIRDKVIIEDSIVQNCIPVSVPGLGLYSSENSEIYWFLPTEGFFNALPESISTDLRKEYNYITAEDKSQLEKPVCKYFDECKNTLKVSSFKVYPNPANNLATVSFTLPEAVDGRITLVDLSGRERQVLQPQTSYAKGQHSISVDLGIVPGGIYLLILYSDKGVQTQRIIVAR